MLSLDALTVLSNSKILTRPAIPAATSPTPIYPALLTQPAAESIRALPVSPDILQVPSGASAQYQVSGLPGWNSLDPIEWSVNGLPAGVTAHFRGGFGNPSNGPLQINTLGSARQGCYPLEVIATASGIKWIAQVTLDVLTSQESVLVGTFTRTLAKQSATYQVGGPTNSANATGIRSKTLIFAERPQKRKLRVTLESARQSTGEMASKPGDFALYRSLVWPADISQLGGYEPNVEQIAASRNGILEWEVVPGAYVLFFVSEYWASPASKIIDAVTYQVEILSDSPVRIDRR